MYNKIFPPIIEKGLILEPNERPCFQLLELYEEIKDDAEKNAKPKAYKASKKLHSTMFGKTCIPLYIEEFKFSIQRVGWLVTKIYSHFTFEQSRHKGKIILMIHKLRHNSKIRIMI